MLSDKHCAVSFTMSSNVTRHNHVQEECNEHCNTAFVKWNCEKEKEFSENIDAERVQDIMNQLEGIVVEEVNVETIDGIVSDIINVFDDSAVSCSMKTQSRNKKQYRRKLSKKNMVQC